MLLYLYIDSTDLQLLNIIGQGSFGTVYTAAWHGSLIAAKVIPVSPSETATLTSEVKILQYVIQ